MIWSAQTSIQLIIHKLFKNCLHILEQAWKEELASSVVIMTCMVLCQYIVYVVMK